MIRLDDTMAAKTRISHHHRSVDNFRAAASTRLTRLGFPSLASLLLGGFVLIFVALNALATPRTDREGQSQQEGIDRFRYGSHWTVQTWIAITGLGFGILSYGFSEAYLHLFDWWCSRQARSAAGLDYGRYLNTQPRAPVLYGTRGFAGVATLRYAVILISLAASIGYKFGLVQVEVALYRDLDSAAEGALPRLDAYGLDGTLGLPWRRPWITDMPQGNMNQCFLHKIPEDGFSERPNKVSDESDLEVEKIFENKTTKGPVEVFLAGQPPRIFGTLSSKALGKVTVRQKIMVAIMKEEKGNFTMARDEDGWHQVPTKGSFWLSTDITDDRAVVAYRVLDGKVQIQWAKLGPWYIDQASVDTAPVIVRLTYEMRYAVAEIIRRSQYNSDGELDGSPSLLSVSESMLPAKASDARVELLETWIDAVVTDRYTDVLAGVSVVLRAAMYTWGVVYEDEERPFGFLEDGEEPYGAENTTNTRRSQDFPFMKYPYYVGYVSDGATGCYQPAAVAYLILGIVAITTMVVRILVGPADITSWTGQHVYLSQTGAITVNEGQGDMLASGYSVAPVGLGRLKLDNALRMKVRADSESQHLVSPTQLSVQASSATSQTSQ